MKRLTIWLLGLTFSFSVFAQQHKAFTPKVVLDGIKIEKTTESGGDELYLTITEFPSKGKPSYHQIPEFPMYWLSSHIDKVKMLKIWSRELNPGEAATLLFALIDKDVPPWNTDDLIGEVKLQIRNDNGQLISSWSVPHRDHSSPEKSLQETQTGQFEFKNRGHYILNFSVSK